MEPVVNSAVARPFVAVPVAMPAPPPVDEYPKVPLVLTGAFSLYVLVWFLEFGQRVALFGALRLEFLLGMVLTAAALISIVLRVEPNHSRLTKFICAYFLFLVIHLPLSQHFSQSWDAFFNWIVKFSCMALFTYAFVRSPRTLRIFMAMLILVFLKIGQEAFLGKITGSMVWENQGIMRLYGTPGSRFGHPNSLSGIGVTMVPFLYYLIPVVQKKWRILLLVLVVFAINIIVFTGSRTGYLATIAVSCFFWLRSTKKFRFMVVMLLIASAGIPAIPPQYESRFMSAFVGKEAEGHSKEARMELATDAWGLFVANPQGLGIYAFRFAREEQLGKEQYDPHNLYLQVLVDLGVVGTVAFGLLVFAVWRELRSTELDLASSELKLRALVKRTAHPTQRLVRHLADVRFMRAVASAYLAFIFTRLVLGVFGHDLYEIYWWLASGTCIAIVNMKPVADARTAAILREAGEMEPSAGTRVPA